MRSLTWPHKHLNVNLLDLQMISLNPGALIARCWQLVIGQQRHDLTALCFFLLPLSGVHGQWEIPGGERLRRLPEEARRQWQRLHRLRADHLPVRCAEEALQRRARQVSSSGFLLPAVCGIRCELSGVWRRRPRCERTEAVWAIWTSDGRSAVHCRRCEVTLFWGCF